MAPNKPTQAKHTPEIVNPHSPIENVGVDSETRNWAVTQKGHLWRVTCEYEAEGEWYLAVIHEGYSESVARILAAAPELLEALKDAMNELYRLNPKAQRQEEAGADHDIIWGESAYAVSAIRAAITKATGQEGR